MKRSERISQGRIQVDDPSAGKLHTMGCYGTQLCGCNTGLQNILFLSHLIALKWKIKSDINDSFFSPTQYAVKRIVMEI